MFTGLKVWWLSYQLSSSGDEDALKVEAREVAARALGELGSRMAVKPLVKALADYFVSTAAATALGQLGDTRAIEPLIKALVGCSRKAAAKALTRLGEPKWEPLIRGDLEDFSRLAASGDPRFVEPLIKQLREGDAYVRHAAATMCRWMGGGASAYNPGISRAAAEALGKLGDRRAVEPLITALGDTRFSSDPDVCQAAARALGQLGDRRAVEPLITALGGGSCNVRKIAAEALGQLGDPRAVGPLVKAVEYEVPSVRLAAAEALARLGEAKWKPLIRGDFEDFARLAASVDPRFVEHLIEALGSRHKDDRRSAARALTGLLTSASSPVISLSRWQTLHKVITTHHEDQGGTMWMTTAAPGLTARVMFIWDDDRTSWFRTPTPGSV